jgi:hypothetical protein
MRNARVDALGDEKNSWPAKVRLRGFAYESLQNDLTSVHDRLGWLARDQDGYSPGIYDQLAATYRRAGLVKDARRVLIAKERRHSGSNLLVKMWEWLLYLTVGFGYRKWLAAWWLAGLLIAGIALFSHAYPGHMQPTAAKVPAFNPVVYTVDVLVPFLNLGQEQEWIPQGWALAGLWVLKGVGWPLGVAITAGLTGSFTRDK